MSRTYYEHVERTAKPDAVAYEIVIFEDPEAIDVVEHETPPPELARFIKEQQQ